MKFNYSQISQNLLKDLPGKQKQVLLRRFGLSAGISVAGGTERETLEAIGKAWNVTRERVRQIEADGFSKLKPKLKNCQKIFQYFTRELKAAGDLRKETALLSQLGGEKHQPEVYFLLTLDRPFQRFSETRDIYSLWTINPDSLKLTQKTIDSLYKKLEKISKPLTLKELSSFSAVGPKILSSYLEVSKIIQNNKEGLYGLKDWPEINPRGVRDKAFLVFKKERKPLHFRELTELIGPQALPQTVHNELIKDPRFVLVGRGTYALKEWGYEEGDVKDVILKILQTSKNPLPREKILDEVFKQRLVKKATILLNLSNKKYFLRDSQGRYSTKEI